MNLKYLACSIAAALAMANAASAVTINISGATAFRAAAVHSIVAAYGGDLTDVAHNGTGNGNNGHEGATLSIFKGNFPGIGPDTVIRCAWSGSVEGIRDLANGSTLPFLTESAFSAGSTYPGTGFLPAGTNARFNVTGNTAAAAPKFAFSDVYATTSPYNVSSIVDTPVGVIPFIPMVNESAPVEFTNITSQQIRATWARGFQKLSLFYPTADPRNVYATGRNDLSGTRTTFLAESGYGFANVVNQWKPVAGTGVINTIQRWPATDAANASSVWNGDVAGNGGFSSGGTLATALGCTSNSVQILNAAGQPTSTTNVLFVGILGSGDAATAKNAGAKALAYNGVGIVPAADSNTALLPADIAKITSGAYTMWSYEHLFYAGSLDANEQALFDSLTDLLPTNLGASGISLDSMTVGRGDDGDVVGP